jgi:Ca2+-binding RTX toxin-like protein
MAILNGTEGADNFSGTADDDTINGLGGNDRLIGMEGNDVVNGDAGDDELHGSWGNDTLNGGDGFDIIAYLNSDAAVTINLGTGGAAGGFADGDQFSGVEGVSGSQLNDALWGDATANTLLGIEGDDRLIGMAGDDVIDGGAGNDELHGSWGADTLNGGDGFDLTAYLNSDAGVTVNLATGEAAGGYAAGDQLSGIEGVSGSQLNDTLTGDAAANALIGLEGDDVLTGAAGADALDGGAGSDFAAYEGSAAAVTVDLVAGTGIGGDAEGDTLTGIENLIGSSHDDSLTGSDVANIIRGGAGADTINGGAGTDSIDAGSEDDIVSGGADIDSLWGGAGNDQIDGGDGDDKLQGAAGADALTGGAGIDVATYTASRTGVTVDLAAGTGTGGDAQGDTLAGIEQLIGSNANDTLGGDAGNNGLWGGTGDDVLTGAAGADTLKGGAGNDSFVYTAIGDSTVAAAGKDAILDFAAGDRMDLSGIDADGNEANGDTAFTFGTGNFTAGAGQLRVVAFEDGRQGVYLETTGDKIVDAIITVYADHALTAADFML